MARLNSGFGEYLKQARRAAGIPTQEAAAEAVTKLGRKVSQSLIAQYETGRISDPDPAVLRILANLYGRDYMELIFHLVRSKYEVNDEWVRPGISQERWKLLEAALKGFETVGEVRGLESDQLRAKAALVAEAEVLDPDGIAAWQKNFPSLEVFWVVAPDFLDDRNSKVLEAVVYNLKRAVRIVYFVQDTDLKRGARFWRLQRALAQEDPELSEEKVQDQTQGIPLSEEDLRWLSTDHVIANPHWGNRAVGFANFRRSGRTAFAIRMSEYDLATLINRIGPHVVQKVPLLQKVLPLKVPSSKGEAGEDV